MWKTSVVAAAILAASTGLAAADTSAVAVSNVNLRAGPATTYPAVTVVPASAPIVTYGCVAGYSWCDVGYGPYRGWVAAPYIQVVYQGAPVVLTAPVAPRVGVVVVGFDRTYWNRYYTSYPWYGRWASYPPYGAPRVTSHGAAVSCGGGQCTSVRGSTGYYGGATVQTRTCGGGECSSTRTTVGPNGGVATRTRSFER